MDLDCFCLTSILKKMNKGKYNKKLNLDTRLQYTNFFFFKTY